MTQASSLCYRVPAQQETGLKLAKPEEKWQGQKWVAEIYENWAKSPQSLSKKVCRRLPVSGASAANICVTILLQTTSALSRQASAV